MAALIHGPLAEALQAGRERFNALFIQARRAAPNLEPGAFGEFLRTSVAPVVERVAAVEPESLQRVAAELYELSLEMLSRDLPGRCPVLAENWQEVLGGLPEQLARHPRLFATSITNALYNLETTPGARPRDWVRSMLRLGAEERDVPTLLEAGKVASWRAGMAHYRDGALAACDELPEALGRTALGLADGSTSPELRVVLQRLRSDPWLRPEEVCGNGEGVARRLRLVARVGAFRGFGGTFLRPPRLTFSDGQIFTNDGEAYWVMHADAFGRTLHRAGTAPPDGARRAPSLQGPFQLNREGVVRCGPHVQTFPELREPTSVVWDQTTLAVTIPSSHAVYVVALAGVQGS